MTRRSGVVVTLLAAGLLAACGSSGSSDSSAESAPTSAVEEGPGPGATSVEPDTTEAPAVDPDTPATTDTDDLATSETTVTTEPVESEGGVSGRLVGQWVTDARAIFSQVTAQFGAPGTCSGPYVLTFGDDGSLAGDLDLSCDFGGVEASGEIGFAGRYSDDGSTIVVSDTRTEGSLTVAGAPFPTPLTDGVFQGFDVPASYTIEGDVLTIDFTGPGGAYSLQFDRLA